MPTAASIFKGAFAINVGAEKGAAEGFERGHDLLRMKRDVFTPTVGGDLSFVGVERDDDFLSRDSASEGAEKAQVEFSFSECGAADDDLRRAELD